MASGQERWRLGALGVLRHLVNNSGPFMADKKALLLLGLRPILAEPGSIKVPFPVLPLLARPVK